MPTHLIHRRSRARRIAPRAVTTEGLIALCILLAIALVGVGLSRAAPVQPVAWVSDPALP